MSKMKHWLLCWLWKRCRVYIDHEPAFYDDWELAKEPILVDNDAAGVRVVYRCKEIRGE